MRLASRSKVLLRGIASYSVHEPRSRQNAATALANTRRERALLIEGGPLTGIFLFFTLCYVDILTQIPLSNNAFCRKTAAGHGKCSTVFCRRCVYSGVSEFGAGPLWRKCNALS